ncbi:DHA2 family efflux MFS transporter permease subunit [Marinomonas ostreistagni]|uniref:DHA2 family efflux MFS transporter permease subunit n=1 Tax=Marinomonas ostreistagni TaxID=359209 RepID=A0ABS0ZFB9_9GAMM|nr:DHA2 family efflux MFS transporter permease subunit [Marinomonas ostreistagni]MBJ7551601.1 DHA2 family efflux MFS transporter permease subunit [Marinomonas ostreistagni]
MNVTHELINDTGLTRQHYHRVILCLIVGSVLPLLDATVVGVMLPVLAQEFSTSLSELQWVATLYALAAACTIPLTAWLTRCFGSKNIWLLGLSVFLLGSLLCGISDSPTTLILSRIIQGVGAGILTPVMQSVLLFEVGRGHFKAAMAAVAVPAVIAPILGPVLAGWLMEFGSWRWVFLINLPIATLALVLAKVLLTQGTKTTKEALDWQGWLLFSISIGLILYLLSNVSQAASSASSLEFSVIMLVVCLMASIAFIRHALSSKSAPIVDIRLFSISSFFSSCGLLLISSSVFYGSLFILPLFLIEKVALSPFLASVMISVSGIGALFSRSYIAKLVSKLGTSWTAYLGITLAIVGTIPLLFPLTTFNTLIVLAVCMFIRGGGLGILTLLAMTHAYHDVPTEKVADASSLSRTMTMLGAAFGAAAVVLLERCAMYGGQNGYEWVIYGLLAGTLCCVFPAWKLRV